jgi:hypothetical protein
VVKLLLSGIAAAFELARCENAIRNISQVNPSGYMLTMTAREKRGQDLKKTRTEQCDNASTSEKTAQF